MGEVSLRNLLTLSRVRKVKPHPSLRCLFSLFPVSLLPGFRCHQLKEDTEFQEFLSVHQRRVQAATWANDGLDAEPSRGKSKPASDYLNFDSDSGQESEEEGAGEDLEGEDLWTVCSMCTGLCLPLGQRALGAPLCQMLRVSLNPRTLQWGDDPSAGASAFTDPKEANLERKAAVQKELSDMDYLKSKMVKARSSSSSEEEESEDEAVHCDEGSEVEEEGSSSTPALQERDGKGVGQTQGTPAGKKRPLEARAEVRSLLARGPRSSSVRRGMWRKDTEKPANQKEPTTCHTVKLRGAPFNVTEKNVMEFLAPLKPVAIRIVRNAHGNKTGLHSRQPGTSLGFRALGFGFPEVSSVASRQWLSSGKWARAREVLRPNEVRKRSLSCQRKDSPFAYFCASQGLRHPGAEWAWRWCFQCLDGASCCSHGPFSREWHGTGASQGWAQYHVPLGTPARYIFVDFSNEEEVKKALKCNREYMGGRYIEVFREKNSPTAKGPPKNSAKSWQGRMLGENEEEEDLAESGRLFVRNLPYTSTEEDLEKLFSKYGPLSELHYPIDSLTKKPKGFAFVTFMFPEHAVKAYSEVDGQVFQGRMLHVLPSTIKKETSEDASALGSSSYKKKKEAQEKAHSARSSVPLKPLSPNPILCHLHLALSKPPGSHNWNTLFMGPNAVADAIAQKYSATKSQVFDHRPLEWKVLSSPAFGNTPSRAPALALFMLLYEPPQRIEGTDTDTLAEVQCGRPGDGREPKSQGRDRLSLRGCAGQQVTLKLKLNGARECGEAKGSVAVRVALGETQLVQEVRRFLIDNGVSLDSFSQPAAERSKTVILVKNLPAGTLAAELQETFGRFGSLGRVLLPEGGITAIVEFLEPLEARKAFRHLAYSKFHHVPLYLEWAPVGIFSSAAPQKKEPQDAPPEPTEKDQAEPETGLAQPAPGIQEVPYARTRERAPVADSDQEMSPSFLGLYCGVERVPNSPYLPEALLSKA
ncbi:hypothetical protein P7K49_020341 [Saguinus oedipus]|uniref:RRM domain-containing protein n=1 Tax=Saguinus oedipus TaxID=9490 RepID=A0ABQ9UZZ6_SAGOE|nr:hypothetical protein P7K49_020341 [Saguinus oedipus]